MAFERRIELEIPSAPLYENGLLAWLRKVNSFLRASFEVADRNSDRAINEANAQDEPLRKTFEKAEKVIKLKL